jgi:hypothetical protein
VDNVSVYTVNAAILDTYVPMSVGSHYVVVQAWDATGAVFKAAETINVAGANTAGVTVTSPMNGATVGSPVNLVASARSAYPITGMRIYVDHVDSYATAAASLNTALPMSPGQHYVVVQAWDSTGAVFKTPVTINVTSTSNVPSYATVITNIDQLTGWESCTTCAGAGGAGPNASYSMSQFVGSPSMDGASAQFSIGGSIPYSNALWWKQLGGNNAATHFVYDLWFYLTQPQNAQALEFDVNQSAGGYKYIFGTQCDIRHTGQWEIWDGAAKAWRQTGVACPVPAANTWHHLVEEFQRDSNGLATFVSITLDGVKYNINQTSWSIGSSVSSEINVAFQMDGDYAQHPYSAWLDKVTLSYW